MSEKKNKDRGRSSSSSSSSSSDEEYKNLPKAERKEKKRQRKLLEKDKKKERKERDRSSSSSSSSSDEDDKNISKKRKQKKKEKKSTERKNKDRKLEKGVKERRAKGKENERPIPVLPATAKKADVKVPSAEESGEAKATQDRGKDEDDSDTGKKKGTKQKNQEENVEASASGRQKKQYKTEELRRLQDVLQKEKSHIRKPRQRPHFPFVWTSLEPYYNTQTAAFLIDLPEEFRHSYVSRNTAIGLCDPWIDLKMDHEILPKIDSANRTSTRGSQNLDRSREREKKETEQKEKKEKKGSTRLPKFPVVPFHAGKENATMRFPYQDIPKFRQDMEQRFSLHAPKKVENDYKRTKDDFYRMDLDKLEEVHPMNRPHMRKAYFAYLQNTPGSKKAVAECVRSLDDTHQPKNTGSPQKAN